MDFIQGQEEELDDGHIKFRSITGHEGPLNSTDKHYKGSKYNGKVEWETGETTYEPLDLIARDAL